MTAFALCALSGAACESTTRVGGPATEQAPELKRAQVEKGRGLRDVRVEEALLDAASVPMRGQVTLSYRSQGSRRVTGAFQWKDQAGINVGGRVEVKRVLKLGEPGTFTGFAPSPQAYRYVFYARGN